MLLVLALLAQAAVTAPGFVERPCVRDELKGARCGYVEVPEDRTLKGGRTIKLNVVIVPVLKERRFPPLYDIEGGPGNASTNSAAFYLTDGKPYREARDVVLVDQRGTGGSNPLTCPKLSQVEASGQPMYPEAEVIRCRDELSKRADLGLYGTKEAVADLDEVRAALGQDRIDLTGISYGTTFALRYMATHPDRVRAAVLVAPVPASTRPPRDHALVAQEALDRLFAQCRDDEACRNSFDPRADLPAALQRLTRMAGAPPREVFLEKLRRLMYQPSGARKVPYILNAASKGDLQPFRSATKSGEGPAFAEGVYLSITCGESIALTDMTQARKPSRATDFGDYRLRRQQAACRHWPAVTPAKDQLAPVRTDIPVLIVSGSEDPVASLAWAKALSKELASARLVEVPGGGHGLAGMPGLDECFDSFVVPFLETGDLTQVDASCVATLKRPAFVQAPAPNRP